MIILSDLSEVMISGIVGTEKIIAARYGKAAGRKFHERHSEVNHVFCDLLRGKMTENEYWGIFFKEGEWSFGVDEAKAAFGENMTHTIDGTLKLYQRIISYPRSLSGEFGMASGMPTIYIVSDHIAERINEIKAEHLDVFRIVKDEFWSCDMGLIKSDPGFFPRLLKDGHLKPDEVLFIDDNPINVIAALKSGITGIRFHNAKQLETVLRDTYGFRFAPEL